LKKDKRTFPTQDKVNTNIFFVKYKQEYVKCGFFPAFDVATEKVRHAVGVL